VSLMDAPDGWKCILLEAGKMPVAHFLPLRCIEMTATRWNAINKEESGPDPDFQDLEDPENSRAAVVHPHPPIRVEAHRAERFAHPYTRQALADLIEHGFASVVS